MTQKEIEKFLANTKVYVNGKSKDIQEKLFSLGYEWNDGDTDVSHTDYPFLYIDNNHHILYGSDMGIFSTYKYREISFEEILSIQITVPIYRPFKDKDECWAEMQKHQPFGWLKEKEDGVYCQISRITDNNTPFYDEFNVFVFADGTPFGIKED